MNKRLKRYKQLIFVGAITLFTALVWISLDSYHQIASQERIQEVSDLIKPLNPKLDSNILDQIESRKEYQPAEVESLLLPTPTPTEEGLSGSESEAEATEEVLLEQEEPAEEIEAEIQ